MVRASEKVRAKKIMPRASASFQKAWLDRAELLKTRGSRAKFRAEPRLHPALSMFPHNSMVFASHPTISSVTVAVVAKNCCKIIFSDMGLITGVLLTAASVIFMF